MRHIIEIKLSNFQVQTKVRYVFEKKTKNKLKKDNVKPLKMWYWCECEKIQIKINSTRY